MKNLLMIPIFLFSTQAFSFVGTESFTIVDADQVSLDPQECLVALRSTLSREELENKPRYQCYGLHLRNVTIELENGEQRVLSELKTPPMMELLGNVRLGQQCSERIVDAMNRRFQSGQLAPQETLELPRFEAFGVEGESVIHANTVKNRVLGLTAPGRESINYRLRGQDELNCHPQIDPPGLQVVENLYEEPSEDRGVLRNMGRHLRGLGFETLRATENVTDFIGTRVFNGGASR